MPSAAKTISRRPVVQEHITMPIHLKESEEILLELGVLDVEVGADFQSIWLLAGFLQFFELSLYIQYARPVFFIQGKCIVTTGADGVWLTCWSP